MLPAAIWHVGCLIRIALACSAPAQPRTQAATENQHNTMQHYFKTIGALAAASALVAGTASAEVEYEIHTGYTSEYVWRGFDLGDDLTEVGLDAATTYNDIDLSAGIWATAFDDGLPKVDDDIDSEVDFYAEVSKDFGFATFGLGYIYYWNVGNTNGGLDAQEIYITASRDFGFAEAYLSYFFDVDGGGTNGYTELGLSRSFELNQCLSLGLATSVGYFSDEGDFGAWATKVTLDWGFAENAKLSPFVALSVDLTETAGMRDEFFGGCMLAVGF
jgi:uncharacterized protein (TIGR02001 family)